jgi:hypothetical protein
MRAACSAHLILLDFITLIILQLNTMEIAVIMCWIQLSLKISFVEQSVLPVAKGIRFLFC